MPSSSAGFAECLSPLTMISHSPRMANSLNLSSKGSSHVAIFLVSMDRPWIATHSRIGVTSICGYLKEGHLQRFGIHQEFVWKEQFEGFVAPTLWGLGMADRWKEFPIWRNSYRWNIRHLTAMHPLHLSDSNIERPAKKSSVPKSFELPRSKLRHEFAASEYRSRMAW